jgi:hypothetical protein
VERSGCGNTDSTRIRRGGLRIFGMTADREGTVTAVREQIPDGVNIMLSLGKQCACSFVSAETALGGRFGVLVDSLEAMVGLHD